LDNIEAWSAVKSGLPLPLLGTRSHIQYERGRLHDHLWNYPFSLCVGPLVSALAAGNAVVLKPSELTPHVASVIKTMAEVLFEGEVVSVFEGDADVAGQLLKLPFDHIFFTGSPAVGKLVMKAASDNLASVTLELGGKSPVIVTESARIREAAQRIAFRVGDMWALHLNR
jgi:aldehyde dehydrogenase (NAD+)